MSPRNQTSRNQMKSVISQHRMNYPSITQIDISSCPMGASDKEVTQAPSRQGNETKQEESGVRRQSVPEPSHRRAPPPRSVRGQVHIWRWRAFLQNTTSATNTTIVGLGSYVFDSENDTFPNTARSAPTPADVQCLSALRCCKGDGNR
jgi:hypothetical protein